MSHSLPPLGHTARDMFDMQTLVDISTGKEPVHCNRYALRNLARKAFAAHPAAKRFVYFYVRGDTDTLQLVSIGKRDGFKVEWTFGPITRQTVLI